MRGLKPPGKPAGKRQATFAANVRPLIPASVSGGGTTGAIPEWTGASALGNSGMSMDANNRLVLPKGLVFPGGGTQDAPGGAASWAPIDRNTVAYWPLGEDSPAAGAMDVASPGSSLAPSNRPGIAAGNGGPGCRTFNGTSQYFNNVAPQWGQASAGVGSWTLEGWFLIPTGVTAAGTIWKLAATSDNTKGSAGRLTISANGISLEWLWGGTAVNVVDSSTGTLPAFSTNAWHHFAVRKTLDRSLDTASVDFFIDNVLKNTVSALHNCDDTANVPANWSTWIGQDGGWNAGYLNVDLQKLRFSRVARTTQEIADFYNNSPTLG